MRHHVNCEIFFRFEEEDDTAEGSEKVWSEGLTTHHLFCRSALALSTASIAVIE